MKNPKVVLFEVFLICFIIIASSCTEGIDLFVNVEKGDSYKYDMTQSTSFEMEAKDRQVSISEEMNMTYLINIKNVDENGIVTAEYLFDSIKGKMETPMVNMSFDSTTVDENDPMSKYYNNLTGKGFTVRVASNGEIIEVTGLGDTIDSIINSELENSEEIKQNIQENLSDNTIKSMIEQTTMVLPNKTIKPGYTWEHNISMDSVIGIDINFKYTLDKIENETAYISMDADFSTDASKLAKEYGIDAKGSLSGVMTGNIEVSINNAFISTGSMNLEMSGGLEYYGVKIPIKLTSEASYKTIQQ